MALRWSPARTPRPPLYCGSVSLMPNSGEKYATRCSGESVRCWNQRGSPRAVSRRSLAARVDSTMPSSAASSAQRCGSIVASSRSGSWPDAAHGPGSRRSKRCLVSRSQVQCRFIASSRSAVRLGGIAGTTEKCRTARMATEGSGTRQIRSSRWCEESASRDVTLGERSTTSIRSTGVEQGRCDDPVSGSVASPPQRAEVPGNHWNDSPVIAGSRGNMDGAIRPGGTGCGVRPSGERCRTRRGSSRRSRPTCSGRR